MRLTTAMLAGMVVSAAAGGSVLGQEGMRLTLTPALGGLPILLATASQDAAIERAFRVVLNRPPSAYELRRYRMLMQQSRWTEADVRRDLRERSDYRPVRVRPGVQSEAIVRRAYQDILGRDPDADGMRTYTSKIVDEGWSERDVREALRRSAEYGSTGRPAASFRTASADRIIRRAYQDILGREPDASGLRTYRRNILENGWDEQDVRQALIRSPERRQTQAGVGDREAMEIVRRAYRSVLNREPDANGMRDYTARVLFDHWSEGDVVQALRDSDEYRSQHP